MAYSAHLLKISDNDCPDIAIVLSGLGTKGKPHPDLTSFLVKQGMEVHFFDRGGDILLQKPQAIEQYCRQIQEAISSLIHSAKRIHLVGISFGGFLSLKIAGNIQSAVNSIVAIAPLIDPYATLLSIIPGYDTTDLAHAKLANNLVLPILRENIESVKDWVPEKINVPGIVIMGENDEFENTMNLNRVLGSDLSKHILPGVYHGKTTGHPETRRLLTQFYAKILPHS